MVQPPKTRPVIRAVIGAFPVTLPWNETASPLERAVAIRAHLLPLIRSIAAGQRASGLPVLMVVAPPYTITYRRPLVGAREAPHRLEVRHRRRLMVLEWSGRRAALVAFSPGPWEREVLALRAVRD